MSKTVSGQDVEDMLSSVRRLVSNELPPHRATSRNLDAGKLVLTEAQRIEPAKKPARPRSQRLEDRIAELEAAVSRTEDDWEPDGSEDQSQHKPDRIVYSRPKPNGSSRRVSRITFHDTAEKGFVEAEEAPAKELSEAEKQAAQQAEMTPEAPTPSTFDAALEEAVSESLGSLAPEQLETVREVMKPEAAPTPEVAEVKVENGSGEADSSLSVPAPGAEMQLDQEALRPLVNKLLREELQGEIGERITRNVRKLVRQEIQRALALQELE